MAFWVEHVNGVILHALDQKPKAFFALLNGLELQALVDVKQIDEHRNFRFQDLRNHRFEKIIDGSLGGAAIDVCLQSIDSRKENDRDMAQPLALPDEVGSFEPIHVRHAHIEQNQ